MTTESDPDQIEPAHALRSLIGKISRRLRPTQAGAGLTPTQLSVLATVVRRGPIRLALVSQVEGVNPTMLSRITAKLSRDGLVARRVDPLDRRTVSLVATDRGRRLQRRILAERNDALGQRFHALPASQRQRLVDALPALEALADSLLDQAR
jgi:DNA-binding MarR family transcriptional regulator